MEGFLVFVVGVIIVVLCVAALAIGIVMLPFALILGGLYLLFTHPALGILALALGAGWLFAKREA